MEKTRFTDSMQILYFICCGVEITLKSNHSQKVEWCAQLQGIEFSKVIHERNCTDLELVETSAIKKVSDSQYLGPKETMKKMLSENGGFFPKRSVHEPVDTNYGTLITSCVNNALGNGIANVHLSKCACSNRLIYTG